jgi:hypothetical protein
MRDYGSLGLPYIHTCLHFILLRGPGRTGDFQQQISDALRRSIWAANSQQQKFPRILRRGN